MIRLGHGKTIIFGGPSIELIPENIKDEFIILPPIKRGDIESLLKKNKTVKTIFITDGLFGQNLAIPPMECLEALQKGWTILGSSSIGALRALDLSLSGMIGVGDIYFNYKLGNLKSDADVAVVYDKDTNEELTASIVHLNFLFQVLREEGHLNSLEELKLIKTLSKTMWFERYWDVVFEHFDKLVRQKKALNALQNYSKDPHFNPKKRDALLGIKYLRGSFSL